MQDNPYNLTDKQIQRCDSLIDNAFESVSKSDANLLNNNKARDYLDFRRSSMEAGHPLTYIKKLDKCNKIIDVCGSDNILRQIVNPDSPEDRGYAIAAVRLCLEALKLSNLMQGHNAAEKYVTSTVIYDSAKLDAAISELREKHAKA